MNLIVFEDIQYHKIPKDYWISYNQYEDYRGQEDVNVVSITTNPTCLHLMNKEDFFELLQSSSNELYSFIDEGSRTNWDFDFSFSYQHEDGYTYPDIQFYIYRALTEEEKQEKEKEDLENIRQSRYLAFKKKEEEYFKLKEEFKDMENGKIKTN